jgi:hypothetical protein
VKYFTWDDANNEKLKAERGSGFEEIVFLIGPGRVLAVLEHPNQQRQIRMKLAHLPLLGGTAWLD